MFDNLQNHIHNEKITISGLSEDKNKRENHLCNVILGLICKSKGIPWILHNNKSKNNESISIGWKVQHYKRPGISEDYYFVIFSTYNESGELIDINLMSTNKREYQNSTQYLMNKMLTNLIEKFEPHQINIHRDGQYYIEKDASIIDLIKLNFANTVQISFIAIYDGIVRLFDIEHFDIPNKQKSKRISEGTALQIMNNYYALATYSMKSKGKIIQEKELITAQTISIEFLDELQEEEQIIRLQNIFDLSQCYHGYIFARLKHPVTIHSTRKILDIYYDYLPSLTSGYYFNSDREFFV